ncbi:TraR/DksA C4-type zinc finger protein [Salmonella enterica]|nr:TraR/DksA C4-type zinc finger protein [Salmonella enterica]
MENAMPDICDHANEEMEFLNQIKFSRTPPPVQPSATHCCDCGNPIPKRRREAVAGVRRCVDCQALLEHFIPLTHGVAPRWSFSRYLC